MARNASRGLLLAARRPSEWAQGHFHFHFHFLYGPSRPVAIPHVSCQTRRGAHVTTFTRRRRTHTDTVTPWDVHARAHSVVPRPSPTSLYFHVAVSSFSPPSPRPSPSVVGPPLRYYLLSRWRPPPSSAYVASHCLPLVPGRAPQRSPHRGHTCQIRSSGPYMYRPCRPP